MGGRRLPVCRLARKASRLGGDLKYCNGAQGCKHCWGCQRLLRWFLVYATDGAFLEAAGFVLLGLDGEQCGRLFVWWGEEERGTEQGDAAKFNKTSTLDFRLRATS